MIAAAAIGFATMLRKSSPKRSAGTAFQGVGSHANYTLPRARIAAFFARLPKEIDTPLRPVHTPVAFRQPARPAQVAFQLGQQIVKLRQVICALAAQWFRSAQRRCSDRHSGESKHRLRFWIPARHRRICDFRGNDGCREGVERQCMGEKLAGTMILFSWLTRPGAPEGHWGILLASARTSARWFRSW